MTVDGQEQPAMGVVACLKNLPLLSLPSERETNSMNVCEKVDPCIEPEVSYKK